MIAPAKCEPMKCLKLTCKIVSPRQWADGSTTDTLISCAWFGGNAGGSIEVARKVAMHDLLELAEVERLEIVPGSFSEEVE